MRIGTAIKCAGVAIVGVAGSVTAAVPTALGAAPTKTVQTETVTLEQTLSEYVTSGFPFMDCGAFIASPEFTVTRTNITSENRQIRHYVYTGRLYRVDPETLAIAGSVFYEGRATRIAEFSAGGDADHFTTLQISGHPATIVTDDGRRIQVGTGLIKLDLTTDPPTFRRAGIDDQTAVCEALS